MGDGSWLSARPWGERSVSLMHGITWTVSQIFGSRALHCRCSEGPISECYHDELLFVVQSDLGHADIMNNLVTSIIPKGWNKHHRDRFFHLAKFYIWNDPYPF